MQRTFAPTFLIKVSLREADTTQHVGIVTCTFLILCPRLAANEVRYCIVGALLYCCGEEERKVDDVVYLIRFTDVPKDGHLIRGKLGDA